MVLSRTVSAAFAVPMLLLLAALAVGAAACGTADDTAQFDAAFSCEELADRWLDIQQTFLDELGDAAADELDPASTRVSQAFRRVGAALTEQARDVGLAGCEADLTASADALCDRVDLLSPSGGAGEGIVAKLRDECV